MRTMIALRLRRKNTRGFYSSIFHVQLIGVSNDSAILSEELAERLILNIDVRASFLIE